MSDRHYSTLADVGDYGSSYCLRPSSRYIDMLDCHSIVGLYTYQNRVPCAPSLRWVSCEEREKLLHQGANFHSSVVHYPNFYPEEKDDEQELHRNDLAALQYEANV